MKENIKYLVLIFLVCFSLTITWCKPGKLIAYAEQSLTFYKPSITKSYYETAWNSDQTGMVQTAGVVQYPFFNFLSKVQNFSNISSGKLQITLYFGLLLLSSISVFFLANVILKDKIASFIASLFYILNPFMFASVWNRNLLSMQIFEALYPFSLLLFYTCLKKRKFLYFYIFLLVNFLLSSAFALPSNAIVLWISLFLLATSFVLRDRRRENIISTGIFFLVFFFGWLLTNFWWIDVVIGQGIDFRLNSPGQNDLLVLKSITSQIPIFMSVILGYPRLLPKYYFVAGLAVIFLILVGLRSIKKNIWRTYVILSIFVSIFFLNGSALPTGPLFKFLFVRLSPLRAFRNPYEKFGIVLVLTYSFLFAWGLKKTYVKSRVTAIILILFFLFFLVVPLWRSPFSDEHQNAYVTPPDEYQEVNNILNSDLGEFRVLQTPLIMYGTGAYNWEGGGNYVGTEPSRYLFNKPSISRRVNAVGLSDLWKVTHKTFYTGEYKEFVPFLNVKYVLFHKDINAKVSYSLEPEVFSRYLDTSIEPVGLGDILCSKPSKKIAKEEGSIYYECRLNKDVADLSNYNFLQLNIDSNREGLYRVDIIDSDNQRLVFDGRYDPFYKIDVSNEGESIINLDFYSSTERYVEFNPEIVSTIILKFFPDKTDETPIEEGDFNVHEISVLKGHVVDNSWLDEKYTGDFIDLYEIKLEYYKDRLYASTKNVVINDWNDYLKSDKNFGAFILKRDLDESLNFTQGSEAPNVEFDKIDKTNYQVHISRSKNPFWLVFSETFNPNWEAKSGEKVFRHFRVNGYANGYLVDTEGDFTITLSYRFQDRLDMFWKITIVSLVVIGILSFWISNVIGHYTGWRIDQKHGNTGILRKR